MNSALAELRAIPHWVGWRHEYRGRSKPTKPPISARTGTYARVNEPSDWAEYETAKTFAEMIQLPGVGFVLTGDYIGGDLDDCRLPETGELAEWAAEIVGLAETYVEISPSGTGLRIIARGKVDSPTKCNPVNVEVYSEKRYLTITGNHLPGTPDEIRPAPRTLEMLLARVAAFKAADSVRQQAEAPKAIAAAAQGSSTDRFRRVNEAALANLAAWVPEIFPGAKHQAGTGAFRVSSKQLGRALQEDLSLAPTGIVDFGVADTGDARQGKRTAIDVLIEHGGAPDAVAAGLWLAERLGVPFERSTEIPQDVLDAVDGMIARANEIAALQGASSSSAKGSSLKIVDAASLASYAPPSREFLVADLIPARTVTMLGGDGGTGKSLLALMLALSVAAGTHWLGMPVERGGVVYVSAEDELDEVHRRLFATSFGEGVDLATVDGLSIVPLAGESAILALPTREGVLATTKLWIALCEAITQRRPSLVVLDTQADFFGGNEIDRAQVRQFVSMLRGLALKSDCAVLLLSHPSVAGMNSGTGLSGSTAWNNSVRSRLYFDRVRDSEGRENDSDLRTLKVMKANYASVGDEIRLRYSDGRFVAEIAEEGISKQASGARAERVFLELLTLFASQGRDVSPKPSQSFAPSVFEKHPNSGGIRKNEFRDAMERLLQDERIQIETFGPKSHQRSRLAVVRTQRRDEE